jgi:hypothetical protein
MRSRALRPAQPAPDPTVPLRVAPVPPQVPFFARWDTASLSVMANRASLPLRPKSMGQRMLALSPVLGQSVFGHSRTFGAWPRQLQLFLSHHTMLPSKRGQLLWKLNANQNRFGVPSTIAVAGDGPLGLPQRAHCGPPGLLRPAITSCWSLLLTVRLWESRSHRHAVICRDSVGPARVPVSGAGRRWYEVGSTLTPDTELVRKAATERGHVKTPHRGRQ